MTDLAQWQANNDQYLGLALQWLRLRLARLATGDNGLGDEIAAVAERMASVTDPRWPETPPPALRLLGQQFGLSSFEEEILLLCAGLELDTGVADLCAQAQGNPGRNYPTFALALALFDDPVWEALAPEGPLRFWHLLEIHQPAGAALTASALRADERIVNYLKGLNTLDDRLDPFLYPFVDAPEQLPPSQTTMVDEILTHLRPEDRRSPVIQLLGADSASKQLVAQAAADRLRLQLYRLPVNMLPDPADELNRLQRLWQREAALLPVALYIDSHHAAGGEQESSNSDHQLARLDRFLARQAGICFVAARDTLPNLDAPSIPLEVDRPTPAEQREAWAVRLPAADGLPTRLAAQFDLNLTTIGDISRRSPDDVWSACLVQTRPRLDNLAQRIDAKATWDDIVLPDAEMSLLRQLAAQVRQRGTVYDAWGFRARMNRGLGISALFAGESGTGKTMAAEVLANDLQLNLYRIDLSAVVSKYIGETEKNLRRLFDAAENGGAILFFDEADALFGKRSEVKDSHDRYANIEINYLLQRMEAFRGLAILATNMKSALDQAFMRRLRFVVNFAFPNRADRIRIWQRVFPEQTPVMELDFDHLARLTLTGGSIHNIALNAAFLAADHGSPVTMPLVLQAARTEFHKIGRPVSEADFRLGELNGKAA